MAGREGVTSGEFENKKGVVVSFVVVKIELNSTTKRK